MNILLYFSSLTKKGFSFIFIEDDEYKYFFILNKNERYFWNDRRGNKEQENGWIMTVGHMV